MSLIKTDFVDGVKLEAADLNSNFQGVLVLHVFNEDFTVLTDGSETTFTTAFRFVPGTLRVYLEGERVKPNSGTPFFTEVLDDDGNGKSFTMSTPPGSGDELIVDYQRSNA